MTFENAALMFLDWAKTHRSVRTHGVYEVCVGKLRDYFGKKMLSQVSASQIEAYKVLRVKEGARVRPNRELAALRNMFNKAIKFKKFEGQNPVQRFEPLKESRGKDRILDPEEEKILLQKAG